MVETYPLKKQILINVDDYVERSKYWIMPSMIPGADTGGVDRVDIHPPFFSKKKFEMSLYLK